MLSSKKLKGKFCIACDDLEVCLPANLAILMTYCQPNQIGYYACALHVTLSLLHPIIVMSNDIVMTTILIILIIITMSYEMLLAAFPWRIIRGRW